MITAQNFWRKVGTFLCSVVIRGSDSHVLVVDECHLSFHAVVLLSASQSTSYCSSLGISADVRTITTLTAIRFEHCLH